MPRCGLVHFVSSFEVKSDTKWLVQLARHLDEGFDLSAVCFYGDGPIQEQLEALGVSTFNLQTRNEFDPRAVLRARRILADLNCDIVHTHLLRADLYAGAAARWAGVKTILSTVYAMGQYRRAKRRRSDHVLDIACTALPTHVVAVANAVKQDCIQRLNMKSEDISVIHTGIDAPPRMDPAAAAALRREWGVAPHTPLIVTAARLSYEKGVDTLIHAAAVLRQTYPQVRIVVVGEGPFRADLETLIRAHQLRDVVQLDGFHENVWPALAAADIVCMPSKSEGMPNALLEAMVIGKPIVATRAGGIPEAVESERSALLVQPEDPRDLAAALGRLVVNREFGQKLGEVAQRVVQARFSAKRAVADYALLYRRLLAERKREDELANIVKKVVPVD